MPTIRALKRGYSSGHDAYERWRWGDMVRRHFEPDWDHWTYADMAKQLFGDGKREGTVRQAVVVGQLIEACPSLAAATGRLKGLPVRTIMALNAATDAQSFLEILDKAELALPDIAGKRRRRAIERIAPRDARAERVVRFRGDAFEEMIGRAGRFVAACEAFVGRSIDSQPGPGQRRALARRLKKVQQALLAAKRAARS